MSVAELTALFIAVGSAPILLKIIDWVKAARSGRAQAERLQNRNALSRLVDAEDRAEQAVEWSRVVGEHAARVRRIAIEWGVPENVLPEFPHKPAKEHA